MKSDEEWKYTPFGYGKLIENNNNKATIELQSGGKLYLNHSSISSFIHFSVKSFAADRKILNFEWGVTQDFSTLFSILHKQLELPPNIAIKLHYIKGKLLSISPNDTPLKISLKTHSKLVCMISNVFVWSESEKSENILLFESNQAVCKKEGSEVCFDSVIGTTVMNFGIYFWEIKLEFLEEYKEEEEIFVGVGKLKPNWKKNPVEEEYWGFMCLSGKKFGNGVVENYGKRMNAGDVLGIKLEYKENKGCLSFFNNKIEIGEAFVNVPIGVSPAVTLNYPKIVLKLNNKN